MENRYIKAKVFPSAAKDKVLKTDKEKLHVYVRADAKQNQANQRTKVLLADYLNIPENKIILIDGHRSQNKTYIIKN